MTRFLCGISSQENFHPAPGAKPRSKEDFRSAKVVSLKSWSFSLQEDIIYL